MKEITYDFLTYTPEDSRCVIWVNNILGISEKIW